MEQSLYGFYRAKVVDSKDPEFFGRVVVWIPDIMDENISQSKGLWARPANNPVGGRNSLDDSSNHYMGTSYIPKKGSWVWIFFENGNINKPYYFAALDIEHARTLAENRVGSNYEDKWVLFKSHEGRAVVISDDPDDARVEITGKKRLMTESDDPSGDIVTVYLIDYNQTTILLDEREGQEKLLIRTYQGDFIHVDIDERQLHMYFKNDINIQTDGNLNITVGGNIVEKSLNTYRTTTLDMHHKGLSIVTEAIGELHHKASSIKDEASLSYSIKSSGSYTAESNLTMGLKSATSLLMEATVELGLKSAATLAAEAGVTLGLKSGGILAAESDLVMSLKSSGTLAAESALAMGLTSGAIFSAQSGLNFDITAGAIYNLKATGAINTDGTIRNDQSGLAVPTVPISTTSSSTPSSPDSADSADSAEEANPDLPDGERDT